MARTPSSPGRAAKVELFLELSVLRYGIDPRTAVWGEPYYPQDAPGRWHAAAALLAEDPTVARDSIHTAVAANDVSLVRGFLARPETIGDREGDGGSGSGNGSQELASAVHPFDGWQPLMRLAYTRLPLPPPQPQPPSPSALPRQRRPAEADGARKAHNTTPPPGKDATEDPHPALAIAKLLLDAGADPSGGALRGDASGFRALTGVVGGGEAGQPAHPRAEALARMLLEHGADPLDGQALYNTSLVHLSHDGGGGSDGSGDDEDEEEDDVFWLEFLWAGCKERYMSDVRRSSSSVVIRAAGDELEAEAEEHVRKRWHDPMADGTLPAPPLAYLLSSAVTQCQPRRVAWLLEHGADANGLVGSGALTVLEVAEREGRGDVVELLVRHGARKRKEAGIKG
ncbi:hypothetical protein MN608_00395 [Microdochium nivale]|nr:hypothetical protein MN608_00395 [Microdochium nivale]